MNADDDEPDVATAFKTDESKPSMHDDDPSVDEVSEKNQTDEEEAIPELLQISIDDIINDLKRQTTKQNGDDDELEFQKDKSIQSSTNEDDSNEIRKEIEFEINWEAIIYEMIERAAKECINYRFPGYGCVIDVTKCVYYIKQKNFSEAAKIFFSSAVFDKLTSSNLIDEEASLIVDATTARNFVTMRTVIYGKISAKELVKIMEEKILERAFHDVPKNTIITVPRDLALIVVVRGRKNACKDVEKILFEQSLTECIANTPKATFDSSTSPASFEAASNIMSLYENKKFANSTTKPITACAIDLLNRYYEIHNESDPESFPPSFFPIHLSRYNKSGVNFVHSYAPRLKTRFGLQPTHSTNLTTSLEPALKTANQMSFETTTPGKDVSLIDLYNMQCEVMYLKILMMTQKYLESTNDND